ncbi:peptidase family S41 [Kordia sp. SMS9]|uniref:S41 family peptidase n=1 Tax=Kordia sp. SMS9 TaxID=2282170 RepID=UPI000E0DAFC3|nr:S41 family peptidase [Kordia sp. SMS9]AXG71623.1 peptidase family S41 [Kordia sp. SMS9]
MKKITLQIIIACCFLFWSTSSLKAQNKQVNVTQTQISTVIDSVVRILDVNYIFPEVATKMNAKIQENFKKGTYKKIKDPQLLASTLTEDLQAISKDKHLRVMYNPQQIAAQERVVTTEDSLAYVADYVNQMKYQNFGFKEVKILDGNIGYLDLRGFMDTEYASETAVAAMNFLSSAEVIIIDLRQNGGGSPSMIQLITSYLYPARRIHLNNFYNRSADVSTQTWTLPHVPGKRNPDAKVFVLTSSSTFSAAEEFSYNLKHLERATLIGETTGGGAHPGGTINAAEGFMVWTPTGRAINPITNTNWEGTGVEPHVKVTADKALEVAEMKALEYLAAKATDEALKFRYNWALTNKKAMSNPMTVKESVLKSYIGTYEVRNITMENGQLIYQRENRGKHTLVPVSENEFMVGNISFFRIRFVKENNKIVALEGLYDDGRTDKNLKTD